MDTSFISRFKNSITFFNWDNFIATSDYDLESNSLDIIQNVQSIIAIELLCASQGIDFHQPLKTSPLLQKIHHIIRESVPFDESDSIVHNKIIAILHLVQNNALDVIL